MPCTLKSFAAATALSVDTLTARGATECRRQNTPAVGFPCLDERGEIIGDTACLAAPGASNRGRWDRSRSAPMFGMETLPDGRARGEVVVAETEIDALTLHERGIPAVAVTVTDTVAEAAWREALTGVDRVLVPISPSGSAPAFLADMPKRERDRVQFIRMAEHASINALHADTDADWQTRWAHVVGEAITWTEHDAAQRAVIRADARTGCEDLVTAPDILAAFGKALSASGFAGDVAAAKLLFLVVISRVLGRPVSAAVKGPSSAGKSFLVKAVLRFLPEDAFDALTAMTEKALIYEQEPLEHRVLVIDEAAGLGSIASLIVRSLLSEGRIDYKTVANVDGELQTVRIVREGPTSLITTTTRVLLHRENETRVISITVSDTPEQTREVMQAIANSEEVDFDVTPWHSLQVFLAMGDNRIVVPYAGVMADATEAVAVRMRRDFSNVIGLVRAHALLHQETRTRDDAGRVEATFEDYGAVRHLLEDILADGLEQTVTPQVREVVEAVALLYVPNDDGEGVTVHKLATHLKRDRSTITRRVDIAHEREFVRDIGGGGRGKKKMLVPGEPLPDDAGAILPTVESLQHMYTYASMSEQEAAFAQSSLLDHGDPTAEATPDTPDAEPPADGEDLPF